MLWMKLSRRWWTWGRANGEMDDPRCAGCGRKLAERVDGPAVIKCSRCKRMNEIVIETNYTVKLMT